MTGSAEPAAPITPVGHDHPAGPRPPLADSPPGRPTNSRRRRPVALICGLLFVAAGLAVVADRLRPIDHGKAIRLASAYLAEADPTFRPRGYRGEATLRAAGYPKQSCWEVSFHSNENREHFKGFYVYVFEDIGECVLSTWARFSPEGAPLWYEGPGPAGIGPRQARPARGPR